MHGVSDERWAKLAVTLRAPLRRWSDEPDELMQGMRAFAELHPPAELACSILRTAWLTTTIFSRPLEPCRFCREDGSDPHAHYLQCPVFRE